MACKDGQSAATPIQAKRAPRTNAPDRDAERGISGAGASACV